MMLQVKSTNSCHLNKEAMLVSSVHATRMHNQHATAA